MIYPAWLCPQLKPMASQPRLVVLGSGVEEPDDPPPRQIDMVKSVRMRLAMANSKPRLSAQARREILWKSVNLSKN